MPCCKTTIHWFSTVTYHKTTINGCSGFSFLVKMNCTVNLFWGVMVRLLLETFYNSCITALHTNSRHYSSYIYAQFHINQNDLIRLLNVNIRKTLCTLHCRLTRSRSPRSVLPLSIANEIWLLIISAGDFRSSPMISAKCNLFEPNTDIFLPQCESHMSLPKLSCQTRVYWLYPLPIMGLFGSWSSQSNDL